MRIYAGDLWRGVDPQPQSAPRQLIDYLESLKVKSASRTRQKRFNMLHQGGDHKLIAKDTRSVQAQTSELFDVPGF
jgi:hypothetical protein